MLFRSEYQGGLTATIISWSKWLVSVLCTSILISWASGNLSAPRLFVPKGPPPQRPPRPDLPSPSVYSERSDSDATPSPLHIQRPVPSFSQPLGHPPPPPRPIIREPVPPSPTGPEESTPRISVSTDDLFRQSAASSIGSIPSIPDFPFPAQPVNAESQSFEKMRINTLQGIHNLTRVSGGRTCTSSFHRKY